MNQYLKKIKNRQQGLVLMEAIVALALIGLIAAGFLGAVGTSYKSTAMTMGMTTAESVARSQMEYIKQQGYKPAGDYDIIQHPAYYSINWTAVELIEGKQKITITVNHTGETALVLEGYKVNR
jgi:Tfp pilus assembly protein PilV